MSGSGPVRTVDFSKFPEKTPEVFCAISEIGNYPGPKRSEIADRTGLSKSQVRYRLDRLCEAGIVEERTDSDGPDDAHRYRLVTKYFQAGQNAEYCMELLGEIPEEINSEQLMTLINDMRWMRSQLESVKDVVLDR